jgi:hypothetical protein
MSRIRATGLHCKALFRIGKADVLLDFFEFAYSRLVSLLSRFENVLTCGLC